MNPTDTRDAMAHLHKLYPKAATAWAEARQIAFRDQLSKLAIGFDQFRACANDVAMTTKAAWCPPEAELVKRLRGLVVERGIKRQTETAKGPQIGPDDHSKAFWDAEYRADPYLRVSLNPAAQRLLMRGRGMQGVTK